MSHFSSFPHDVPTHYRPKDAEAWAAIEWGWHNGRLQIICWDIGNGHKNPYGISYRDERGEEQIIRLEDVVYDEEKGLCDRRLLAR